MARNPRLTFAGSTTREFCKTYRGTGNRGSGAGRRPEGPLRDADVTRASDSRFSRPEQMEVGTNFARDCIIKNTPERRRASSGRACIFFFFFFFFFVCRTDVRTDDGALGEVGGGRRRTVDSRGRNAGGAQRGQELRGDSGGSTETAIGVRLLRARSSPIPQLSHVIPGAGRADEESRGGIMRPGRVFPHHLNPPRP